YQADSFDFTSSIFALCFIFDKVLDVILFNMAGQVLQAKNTSSARMISISMESYPAGIYYVKLISQNSVITKKVIKE
ncbi:MAG: hypothetical protein DRI97_07990, partial [Bacteroidetes bacterium]